MNLILKIVLYILLGIILYEIIISYTRFIKRKQVYRMASKKSIELGKPLMVIGDPDNGSMNTIFGRSYGCGDVCIDLTGCPLCPNGKKEYIEEYLKIFNDDSYVVFISCVLEYVSSDQIDFILKELKRISGNNLYVVSVEPFSITALFYPTRLITGENGPNQIILNEYPYTDIKYFRLRTK